MSLPPELIRVKRKASEIEPVSYLRVQEHKRHVTDAFVYERQSQEAAFAHIPTPVQQRPTVHTSGSRHGHVAFHNLRDNKAAPDRKGGTGQVSNPDKAAAGAPTSESAAEQRRFHMSRADLILAASNYPTQRSNRGISKKRPAPALFVERKYKRVPSTKFQSIARSLKDPTPEEAPNAPPGPRQSEGMEVDITEIKQRKKPGLSRQVQKEEVTRKAELPDSMVNRWNVDLDKLTADMNAFAMEQITLSLQRQEEQDNKQRDRDRAAAQRARILPPSSPSRFKPKAPAKRYAERHPEELESAADKDSLGANAGLSDTDEDDYIIETYIRVPASAMNKQHVASKDVGLLVFDEEPDMELFYGAGDDSDDEWAEDDEDENAENYYTADYPDDEVASDDEFGQNAYAYRNGNASDLEEYDATGFQDSPDESDGKNGFKSFISKDGQLSKHL